MEVETNQEKSFSRFMEKSVAPKRYFAFADLFIFALILTSIYGIFSISRQWRADFQPVVAIDLSLRALPRYALFSAIRGLVAYFLSLTFTIVVGYWAAKSKRAERLIIPAIDILQSVPPIGFLPGLLLGLIAIFPYTNTGLELACIITIFTGQVWNMTFSFYSSLKSIPGDFAEASQVMGLSWFQKLIKLELPFSAVSLAWNSLLSMAGGWFFLIVCEAITLGDREYRLPGVGAYMAVALEQQNVRAEVYGVIAMIVIIMTLDFTIFHPMLSWVRRFRLEDIPGVKPPEPLMVLALRESRLLNYIKILFRRLRRGRRNLNIDRTPVIYNFVNFKKLPLLNEDSTKKVWNKSWNHLGTGLTSLAFIGILYGSFKLFKVLVSVPLHTWLTLCKQTGFTFLRVMGALAISTIWAVPAGIWIGTSERRARIAQPIIQIMASFPAPMLYPLAMAVFLALGITLNWGSMFLMLMGVQWYVLFNVLAGSLRISSTLNDTLILMKSSRFDRWRNLYIPSVFPTLVTGWVTAAGGAWNASIVAEYIASKGKVISADGLGAAISIAAANADSHTLAAGLTVMVIVVVSFNRLVWKKLYLLAQTRFRMDM
jgi:NitT/TauT family transport system permease protein